MNNSTTHITLEKEKSYSKLKDFSMLFKMRLTTTVVITSLIAYAMASGVNFNVLHFFYLYLGSTLVVGAANGINQIIEKDFDALMSRTANRPVAANRLNSNEAAIFCIFTGVLGVFILSYIFNPISGILAVFALISYAFVYTPVKRIGPAAVLVGAFPGAVAPLIGWTCATGEIGLGAIMLFVIQFAWQFPHFWAIAWVLDDDYKKAGYRLLPSSAGRNNSSAIQILIYTVILVPVGMLPYFFEVSGIISLIFGAILGLYMTYLAYKLYQEKTIKTAKALMYGSFLYLPLIFTIIWLDKI